VVDRDAALLAEVPGGMTADGRDIRIETRCQNLSALDADMFAGRQLVTASALLDLVSDAWLHLLADRCRTAGATVLFALTYNGASRCSPDEPEDDVIRDLLNRHQKTDKGFGPAAGPDAAECAAKAFAGVGYRVSRGRATGSFRRAKASCSVISSRVGRVRPWSGARSQK
jgi:hypothetical protein